MRAHLRTATPRNVPQRIGDARALQLDELYQAADVTRMKLVDLEILERRAVRNAVIGCGGHAVTTTMSETDEVEERLTILTSVCREDRVQAAVYSVRVSGMLTREFPVRGGSGMGRLAAHVAAHVL
jgi:hypothetical protein